MVAENRQIILIGSFASSIGFRISFDGNQKTNIKNQLFINDTVLPFLPANDLSFSVTHHTSISSSDLRKKLPSVLGPGRDRQNKSIIHYEVPNNVGAFQNRFDVRRESISMNGFLKRESRIEWKSRRTKPKLRLMPSFQSKRVSTEHAGISAKTRARG